MESFGQNINNAFFFVIDKIIDLQEYFIIQANFIGRIVFLIAILSAGLNYALTGTGLKENLIKIFKATVFFMIVIFFYPKIIGWITSYTYSLAEESIYESVEDYFNKKVERTKSREILVYGQRAKWNITNTITEVSRDESTFSNLTVKRNNSRMPYTVVAPANMFKVLNFIVMDCIGFSEAKQEIIPEFANILKGYICAFFIIFTGAFAMLEYVVCFLEFMLVTSVGIILFPLSIWEGSKIMAEGFIKSIFGFFMKMLFCNIGIFLLLYGFVSLLYTLSDGFTGKPDQIIFIFFVCLLFYFICKSAPVLAQSLLSGSPSLSGAGAISAVSGAVAAAGATMGLAKKVGGTVAGGTAKAAVGSIGSLTEAAAARTSAMNDVKEAGGSKKQQKAAGGKAFRSSLVSDADDAINTAAYGLTRSLLGGKNGSSGSAGGGINPHSWRQDFLSKDESFKDHFDERRNEGRERGKASADKYISKNQQLSANRERQKDPDYSSSLDELNKELPGPSNNEIK